MSAKLLYNTSDENPNHLNKQFGCITGLLHVFFYRQPYPSRPSSHGTIPAGETTSETSSGADKDTERATRKKKAAKEESAESSSRQSSSSSPCFSSADVSTEGPPPLTQISTENSNGPLLRAAYLKDRRRFSYDENDSRSNEFKTATKQRDPPRFSLDSSRSNSFTSSRTEPEDGTHRRTSSSIVAKLMGLDDFLDSTASDPEPSPGPSVTARQPPFCDSPRPSYVDPKLTVYGEIQKRLTQLEFRKSGKDLRALKQILEAMEKAQQPVAAASMGTSPSTTFRSSMVTTKPARALKDSSNSESALQITSRPRLSRGQVDSTVKNTSNRSKQTSVKTCSMNDETIIESSRRQHNGSRRLRLQQKKPTTPTSEERELTSRKATMSRDMKSLRSSRSRGNITSGLKDDVESRESRKSVLKPVKITSEQPSPVSVLNADLSEAESPSPVRKISTVFKDDDLLNAEDPEWIKDDDISLLITPTGPDHVECFMEDNISICDMNNTDHKYIAEILLTSGILRDLEYSMISVQLHPSLLPINPDLFLVLEQNKAIRETPRGERIARKLLFDTVNEILAETFLAQRCIKPHIKSDPLMEKQSRERYLLLTLCSRIDQLQANSSACGLDDDDEDIIWDDLENQDIMSCGDFEGENPTLVLDLERLIFKDLINEVVTCKVTAV